MEKSFIDKIASGKLDPLDIIERLRPLDQEDINGYIAWFEINAPERNDGTISGKWEEQHMKDVVRMIRKALHIPDPLLDNQMRDTWQKVKNENGFGDPNTMTDEQVMSAVNLLGKALQAAPEPEQAAPGLPDELKAASKYFDLAATNGLIKGNYQWQESKALLAYFCAKISDLLSLSKAIVQDKDLGVPRPKVSWAPFERLFGVSGLTGSAKDYKRYSDKPTGYEKVDQLFN